MIIPFLGSSETSKITSFDVIEVMNKLRYEKNYSYYSLKRTRDLLNSFYEFAVSEKLAERNVIETVHCKNTEASSKKIPLFFTLNEIKRFSAAALEQKTNGEYARFYGPLMLVYLHTGCRLGELLALKREEDFDKKSRKIVIHSDIEQISRIGADGERKGGCKIIHQESPKTKSSNRTLYLNDTSLNILNYYYSESKIRNCEYLIPPFKKGNLSASPSSVQSTFTAICNKAGISKHKGIHTLRHTFATHLFKNGVDIKTVSALMGHASVRITYDIYCHIIEEELPDVVGILDEVFS
jgi:site-specific recombinase XerD